MYIYQTVLWESQKTYVCLKNVYALQSKAHLHVLAKIMCEYSTFKKTFSDRQKNIFISMLIYDCKN